MYRLILSFLSICIFSVSCATNGATSEILNYKKSLDFKIQPKFAESGHEIDTVVESAYGLNFDVSELEISINKLLEKYPDSGKLHEILAFIAILKSENGKAFKHLIKASIDLSNKNTTLLLETIYSLPLSYKEQQLFIKTLELLITYNKNNEVRQLSRNLLSYYYLLGGNKTKAAFESDSNGFIKDWWIAGSFDNDNGKGFYDEFGPEKELNSSKQYKGKVVNVGWRKIKFNGHRGILPVDSFVSPTRDSLAYMMTTIFSPVEKEVILNISSSDSLKMWVNGTNVLSEENISYFGFDNIRVKVNFKQGNNILLIKTCQKEGTWTLGARITESSGIEATDLVVVQKFPEQTDKIEVKSEIIMPYPAKEPQSTDFKDNFFKGMILKEKGYEKYSIVFLRKAFETCPQNLFAILLMAKALSDSGEEGKYIDLLNGAIIHSSSKLPLFLLLRGKFYANKGQKESAEEDYRKALELNPSSIEALQNFSELYQSKGWNEDSRRTLEKALQLEPDNVSMLVLMARTLNNLNYKEESEQFFRKALNLLPGEISLNQELYQISKGKRDYRASIFYLERIIEINPHRISSFFDLFEIYRAKKDLQNAANQLESIKKMNPDNPSLYAKTGDMHYEKGNNTEALKSWEKAHELDPRNSYISERISYMKMDEKDIAETFVPNDEKIMELIKNSINFVSDDGADTLLIYDHAICRINSDGSSKWYITEVSRALNDSGRDSLINTGLPYDGRKRILKTYSVSSDLVKSEASSVSSYDVRFRQLKKGDFTVIQYIHYKPSSVFLENDFIGQWFVQSPMKHVMHSEWILLYPKEKKLNTDINGSRIIQSFEEIDDLMIHKFTSKNIEPLNFEPNSPPLRDFLETVTVSTALSWDKYVNWEKALLKDAFLSAKEIRDKTQQLTANETSAISKINKIFTFVAQEIRYQQEYESTIAGVRPHTAAQTLERGYGDCKDKAVLFIQLAKEASLKVDYVILRTKNAGNFQKKIPNQQFNHAIVYIPAQEGIKEGFFMDPTVDLHEIGSLRQDDQGTTALKLNIETGNYEFIDIPFQSPELNFQKHERTYSLTESAKLSVKDSITMQGGTSSAFRQTLRTKDVGNKMFQRLANSLFKGGVLDKYEHSDIEDISKPFNISFTADVTNLVSESNNKIMISMPEQIVNSSIITLENRKLPLWTGIPSFYEINVKVEIPDGFSVESMPSEISVSNNCFSIKRVSSEIDRKTIQIKSTFVKNCTEISQNEYPDFRKLILEVIKKQNEYLVLIKK